MNKTTTRIAVVHDWLTVYAGAERVLEQILTVFPNADIFSLMDTLDENSRSFLRGRPVQTSFLQGFPQIKQRYRSYLPLMPLAIEQFDLSGYDLVISSSHAVAKGVITGPDQLHICMCYSPMRYAWDLQSQYLAEAGLTRGIKASVARALLHYMRIWDVRSANGVDEFIAISKYIARRILKAYRRTSHVIYPPVSIDDFPLQEEKDDFYVTVSRLVPYKRVDLIVEAFSRMPDKHLVVIGDGPELKKVKSLARSNIEILGHQPFNVVRDYVARARAFVFAAEEDFGIVAVEAQAAGTPVIAYGKGGSVETVVPGQTGLFFHEQTAESLMGGVEQFEKCRGKLEPHRIRENAERFSVQRFRAEFGDFVEAAWSRFVADRLAE